MNIEPIHLIYDASQTLFSRIYLWTITHFGRWADPPPHVSLLCLPLLLTSGSLFSSCSGFLVLLKHVYVQFHLPLYLLFCQMLVYTSSLHSWHRSHPSEPPPWTIIYRRTSYLLASDRIPFHRNIHIYNFTSCGIRDQRSKQSKHIK